MYQSSAPMYASKDARNVKELIEQKLGSDLYDIENIECSYDYDPDLSVDMYSIIDDLLIKVSQIVYDELLNKEANN